MGEQVEGIANALDVIKLAFIHERDEINGENDPFIRPLFAHQLFKDEQIFGHKKPSIELIYSASDLQLALIIRSDPIDGYHGDVTDIRAPFSEFVQHKSYDSVADMLSHVSKPFTPLGTKVHEYQASSLNRRAASQGEYNLMEDVRYEVYHSNFENEKFTEFHRRMQTLNILFIDGASFIDESESRWSVYTLFERRDNNGEPRYSLVGFATVYRFFAYPDASRYRVSQFLILPHFQKKGHAIQLYRTVYSECIKDSECTEILVEDPTDSFQQVRLLSEMLICHEANPPELMEKKLTKDTLAILSEKLHLGKESVTRIHEIFLQRRLGSAPPPDDERDMRLQVKARLFRKNRDELEALEADARKEKLSELYADAVKKNEVLLRRFEELV